MKASNFAPAAVAVALLVAAHANAADETYPLDVPTDSKAKYELVKVGKGKNGNIIAITKPSALSSISGDVRVALCGYTEVEKFWNTVAMKIAIDQAIATGKK